jgi:nitroreductase
MSAQVLAFRPEPPPSATDDPQALLAAVTELHTLITTDPLMGASPVRVYFVFNPAGKAAIADAIDARDPSRRSPASAYALLAYDFPFALHIVASNGRQIADDRAKAIVSAGAGLQSRALKAAAEALGIDARAVPAFNADALKQAFFPQTQETVIHLFRLELAQP